MDLKTSSKAGVNWVIARTQKLRKESEKVKYITIFLTLTVIILFTVLNDATAFRKGDVIAMWLFDEGSGAVAEDSSGNGRHGEIQGDIIWAKGKFGSALQFPGTNADTWVLIPHDASLDVKTVTITAWVQFEDNGNYQCIISKVEPRKIENYAVWSHTTNVFYARFTHGGEYLQVSGKTELTDGKWHHVAAAYDLKSLRTYVDGKFESEEASTATPDTAPGFTRIGGYMGDGIAQQYPAKGLIDEVAIFNVALPENEIDKIFTKGLAGAASLSPSRKLATRWGSLKDFH